VGVDGDVEWDAERDELNCVVSVEIIATVSVILSFRQNEICSLSPCMKKGNTCGTISKDFTTSTIRKNTATRYISTPIDFI
jgi:hypothetical protein